MNRTTLLEPTTSLRTDDHTDLEQQGRMIAIDLVERARSLAQDQDFFSRCEAMDEITSRISETASSGSPTNTQFNDRVNQITKTILRELNTLLKREEEFNGQQSALALAQDIRELYFSSSSNIGALASPVHILPEIALLCHNPIVQATFGQNLVGNISYELHFSDGDAAFEYGKRAAEILSDSAESLAEKLDMVAQLKTIVAESYNTWSDFTGDFAQGVIMGMSQKDTRPILAYGLLSLNQFIAREQEQPSLPLIRGQSDAFEHVRSDIVTEQEIARDRTLRSQIVLEVPGRPQRIAEDAFVILDQSNFGRYIALIPKDMTLPAPSYDAYMLSLLKEKLKNTETFQFPEKLLQMTTGREQNLLKLGSKCVDLTPHETLTLILKESPETLHLISGYSRSFEEVNNAHSNLQEAIYQGMNQKLVEMFIRNPEEISLSPNDVSYDVLNEKAHIWRKNPTPENLKIAADAIKSNLSQQRLHAIAYKIEQEGGLEIDANLENAVQTAKKEFDEQSLHISESGNHIITDLVAGIENLERSVYESNPRPEVLRYDQLRRRSDFFPFELRDPEGETLQLQHLHNPTVRIPLENDLGIQLSSLPLRSQTHFLRGLTSHDEREFSELQSLLQTFDESERALLIKGYLVAAEEIDLAKYTLLVAQKIDTSHRKKVFEAYTDLISECDKLTDSLAETSNQLGIPSSQELEHNRFEVRRRMLQRANTLFQSFVKLEREDWDAMAEFFKSESAEITRFAGSFAVLKQHLVDENGTISLEKIPGVALEVQSATELTQEHKDQMHAAYKRSLLAYPSGFRPLAYGEFCEALEDSSSSRFHLLTFNDQIVSFLRMDPTPDGYYMASVNTSALVNGFGIGAIWLKGVIDSYPDENILLAYVEGNEQVGGLYEKLGFNRSGSLDDAGGSGTKVYKMTNSFSMKPNFMGPFSVLEV